MRNTAPRTSAAETRSLAATRPPGRKTQLLRIASELFAAKGYPNVSVAQIAAAAGVTAPSIYRHFSDKQAILGEAVLDAVERLQGVTDPELTFDEFIAEMASVTVGRPDLAVLWRWGVMYLGPQWQAALRKRVVALLDRWATRIRTLRPDLSSDEARVVARAMASTVSSAIARPGRLSSTKYANTLADVARRVVAVEFPTSHVDEPPASGTRPDQSASRRGVRFADATGLGAPPTSTASGEAGNDGDRRGSGGRREQLLGAASELFLARGFAAVGVDDLGAAVGITGPSVYRHFPDKQAILAGVCLRGVRSLSDRVEAELARLPDDDPKQRLKALVRAHVSVLLSSPDLVVAGTFGNVELTGHSGQEARDFLRAHVTRWTAALLRLNEDMAPAEAKVIVYAALTLANDLARTNSTRHRPNLEAETVALMEAAVGVGERQICGISD